MIAVEVRLTFLSSMLFPRSRFCGLMKTVNAYKHHTYMVCPARITAILSIITLSAACRSSVRKALSCMLSRAWQPRCIPTLSELASLLSRFWNPPFTRAPKDSSCTLQAPQASRKACNTAQADTLFGLTGHSNGHSTRLKRIFFGVRLISVGLRGTRITFMRRFRLA